MIIKGTGLRVESPNPPSWQPVGHWPYWYGHATAIELISQTVREWNEMRGQNSMTPLERINLTTTLNDIAVAKSQLAILALDMAKDETADRLHITCLDTAVERLDSMAGKVNEILDKIPEGK